MEAVGIHLGLRNVVKRTEKATPPRAQQQEAQKQGQQQHSGVIKKQARRCLGMRWAVT